ncbi:MAG: hypothetical protein ACOYL6_15880 [Bacteriovoracaceae bacterium]
MKLLLSLIILTLSTCLWAGQNVGDKGGNGDDPDVSFGIALINYYSHPEHHCSDASLPKFKICHVLKLIEIDERSHAESRYIKFCCKN